MCLGATSGPIQATHKRITSTSAGPLHWMIGGWRTPQGMGSTLKTKKGSCLCMAVGFEVRGDFESFFLCHCKYCQKDTGSAHAANLFSSQAEIDWTSGKEHLRTFRLPSTRHVKSFCVLCGSALPSLQMEGTLLVVPAGSLDDPISIRPNAHLFMASKAIWDEDLERIKKIEKLPS